MTTDTNSSQDNNSGESDINQPDDIQDQLDQVLTILTDHLDEVAKVLAEVTDKKYGKFTTTINGATWTLKHKEGAVEWFRRSVDNNDQYIISTKGQPLPSEVASALDDYPKFISNFNDWLQGLSKSLEPTTDELANVERLLDQIDPEELLEQRSRLEDQAWNVASHVGNAVAETTGNEYGTFKTTIDDTEWTLKYQDGGSAKYLQVGGTYTLGRDSPHPEDLAYMVKHFDEFIASVNSWLADQKQELRLSVDISETTEGSTDADN